MRAFEAEGVGHVEQVRTAILSGQIKAGDVSEDVAERIAAHDQIVGA